MREATLSTSEARGQSELQGRIRALGRWFHNLDLDGVWTAPDHFLGDYPAVKWRHFAQHLPEDLAGKAVLDIGCNAGFYAFEMERRGASVVAIDDDDTYLQQARFAAEVKRSKVAFQKLSVYDVAALGRRFDIVLCLGLIYHLRHPLLALDLIHQYVAGDVLVFQSMQRGSDDVAAVAPDYPFSETDVFGQPGYPRLHFVEQNYSGDPTNWWVPNRACSAAMLRSAGFEIVATPECEIFICRRTNGGAPPVHPAARGAP